MISESKGVKGRKKESWFVLRMHMNLKWTKLCSVVWVGVGGGLILKKHSAKDQFPFKKYAQLHSNYLGFLLKKESMS